jgi:hypothetical protein
MQNDPAANEFSSNTAQTGGIIYNVTIKVAGAIADDWVKWMKEEHMPDLLATGLFIESRLCRLLEQDESDGITFTAQYMCDSMEDYQEYLRRHAGAMRDKGIKKFGDQFIAFRTVMRVEGSIA